MNSENNSFLDFQPLTSKTQKGIGEYTSPLILAENSDRNQNNVQQQCNSQVETLEQFFPSKSNMMKSPNLQPLNQMDSNDQNKQILSEQNEIQSERKIGMSSLYQGVQIGSNQSSQNNLASPFNGQKDDGDYQINQTLRKKDEENNNDINKKSNADNQNFATAVAKNQQELQQYPTLKSQWAAHQFNSYNNSSSFQASNTFLEKMMSKTSKGKNNSQVAPFHLQSKFTKMQTITTEKNLEQNLTKMVKLVKLKKKVTEIKRFFLKSSFYKMFIQQPNGHFNRVIDDPSCIQIDDQPQGMQFLNYILSTQLVQNIAKLFRQMPTIEPSSKFKLVWDQLVGFVFMTYFFFIPIHVAINVSIHNLITQYVGYILHLFMFIDIFFSMNTAYFEKGVNTSDKKKILIYYVKNYFWGDIISQIPLLVSELGDQDSQVEKIFVLCFFVKLRNFQKIFRKFEDSFHLSPKTSNVISLIKLILTILFFSHIFACIWLFVGKLQSSNNNINWLVKIGMENESWTMQYIAAYYFSTVTMITVGYGDISPMNNLERLICVGTMLISCVIFAYTINQIGTIFSDLFSQDRQMKEFFYIINDYMDNKNIGFSLQYKIREYLDYYWREQDQNKSDLEKKIIDSLSDQLHEKLMIEANRLVLKNYGIFSSNFNQSVILKMIPIIQTLHTTPNQIIFSEGQLDDDMFIYFVEKGKVEVCREYKSETEDKDQKITPKGVITLGPGSCFGAWSFFTNQKRREMVRSLEFSKLLMIKRSEFIELIMDNSQQMERFNMIKDTIIFENNLEFLEVKCQCCNSYNHEIQHCHYFHFSPDNYALMKKDNQKFAFQNRDTSFSRNRTLFFKDLNSMKQASQCVVEWKSQNIEPLDQYYEQYLQKQDDLMKQYEQNLNYDDNESDDYEYTDSSGLEDEEDEEDEYEEGDEEEISDTNSSFGSDNHEDELIDDENNLKKRKSEKKKKSKNNRMNIDQQFQKKPDNQQTNMEKINEELNMSIKNSDDIDNMSQIKDSQSPQETISSQNNEKLITIQQNKRQFSKLTELVELEESTTSNQVIGSDRDSNRRLIKNKKIEMVMKTLGKDGNNNEQMTTSHFTFNQKSEKFPQSDQCIRVRKQELSASIRQQTNNENEEGGAASTELQTRRPKFKQLTVLTQNSSSENTKQKTNPDKFNYSQFGSFEQRLQQRTFTQFDFDSQQSEKKIEQTENDKKEDSDHEFSPQLIFVAQEDSFNLDQFNQQYTQKNPNFQFEFVHQFEDFNLNDDNTTKKTKQTVTTNSNSEKISPVQKNRKSLNEIEERLNTKNSISKQKSVRIAEQDNTNLEEGGGIGLQKRKSSKRSQSQITISDTSEKMKFKKNQDNYFQSEKSKQTDSIPKKRRSSSKGNQADKIQYKDDQQLFQRQENQMKGNRNNDYEKKKKRNSMTRFQDQQSNITDSNYQDSNIQFATSSSQEKKIRMRKSSKTNDYEFQQQANVYSPDIQRRKIPTLDKLRSQSFKNLEIYSAKPSTNPYSSQQSHLYQSQLSKNLSSNQHVPSFSSRGSITQSIQLPFQQNLQQQLNTNENNYSLQDINSQNSIQNQNQNQNPKIKQKQDKQKLRLLKQQKSLLQDMVKQENTINSSQGTFNYSPQTDQAAYHHNILEQHSALQRKDSSDSIKSNTSCLKANNLNPKKKSAFAKSKALKQSQALKNSIQQSQNGGFTYSNNLYLQQQQSQQLQQQQQQFFQNQQQQQLIPPLIQFSQSQPSHQNNLQIPIIYPPSPLPSPSMRSGEPVKNRLQDLINRSKQNSNRLSGSNSGNNKNNDSMSSHKQKSKGEVTPRSTLSSKLMPQDHLIMGRKNLNYNNRNLEESQSIVNQRRNSIQSIHSTTSNKQNNILGINRLKQMSEQQTPLLRVNLEKSMMFSNQKLQLKQQGSQQSQFYHTNKDRSPTSHDNIQHSTQLNVFQNNPQYLQQSMMLQPNINLNQNALTQQGTLQGYALFNQNDYNNNNNNNYYEIDEEKNIFTIMHFEEMKFYQYYFPKGNSARIISKANVIISKNFVKFYKQLKKAKAQSGVKTRKAEDTTINRRGSQQIKRTQLNKKKSQQMGEAGTTPKNTGIGGSSDDKIETRQRGQSVAFGNHNLDESQFSNDSDNTHHRLSQLGSPSQNNEIKQSNPDNNNALNNNNNNSNKINHLPFSLNSYQSQQIYGSDPKKMNTQTPKSIFNRQNQNNNQ